MFSKKVLLTHHAELLDGEVMQWLYVRIVQLRIAKVKQTTTNGIDST